MEAADGRLVVTARSENHIRGRPDLADTVARLQAFAEAGADVLYAPGLRSLDEIRTVVSSEAYALSSGTVKGNERDNRFFSHQMPRALTAHQMADALAQATDVPNRFPLKSAGTRAIQKTSGLRCGARPGRR